MIRNIIYRALRRLSGRINIILYPSFVCNYKCPYCVISESGRLKDYPKNSEHGWMEWAEALNRLPAANISVSGGETTLYPGLISLIEALSKKHSVFFTTNLSRLPEELLRCKRKDIGISASFHPSMTDFESFRGRVETLKKSGFKISVEMVAHPSILEDIAKYKALLEREIDVSVSVDPCISPEFKYSAKEKDILRKLGVRCRKLGFDFEDSLVFKKCRAGSAHFVMVPNGDVFACHAGFYYVTSPLHKEFRAPREEFYLGNVFDNTFNPLKNPKYCTYPCSEACDLDGASVREIRKSAA